MSMFRNMGTDKVTVIHAEGTDSETRTELEAHIQPKMGFFALDAPIYEGDVVLVPDPRGGNDRRLAGEVNIHKTGSPDMRHTEVSWAKAPPARIVPVRRLSIEGFHPAVVAASGDLFADGHFASAILEAFKQVELRVRAESSLDATGQDLMTRAFHGEPAPIDVRVEAGVSGRDEQEGFRFLFMGAARGIRNPKAHEAVNQLDPQRALEYLGFASLLLRRIDDAVAARGSGKP
jgi:uncharacterized protein (TIGR02391 family)